MFNKNLIENKINEFVSEKMTNMSHYMCFFDSVRGNNRDYYFVTTSKKWVKNNDKSKRQHMCDVNMALTFDIETTSFAVERKIKRKRPDKDGNMYDIVKDKHVCVYSYCVSLIPDIKKPDKIITRIYRIEEDIDAFFSWLADYCMIKDKQGNIVRNLVCYVHNLAYEFQFCKGLFNPKRVFCVGGKRAVVECDSKWGITFRCSYRLTLKSLNKLTEDQKIKKMVGDLDYNKVRNYKTRLLKKERGYIANDTRSLAYYIAIQIQKEGCVSKIPMTQTGYVRRETVKFMKQSWAWKDLVPATVYDFWKQRDWARDVREYLTMEFDEYKAVRHAYQGGYCHANPYRMLKNGTYVIYGKVVSLDFTSSYPAVICQYKFPMSKGVRVTYNNLSDFMADCQNDNVGIVAQIVVENVEAKTCCNCIPASKCVYDPETTMIDNGKIVTAERLQIDLCDVDFNEYADFYNFDLVEIRKSYKYQMDYLPLPIILLVLKLYKDKTALKDVPEKLEEYGLSKALINAIYGMMCTNPLMDEYVLCDGVDEELPYMEKIGTYQLNYLIDHADQNDTIQDLINKRNAWQVEHDADRLRKYNSNRNRVLFYPWGVYVCAWARKNLLDGIKCCGDLCEDWLYSDTDSIKLIHYEKHKDAFDEMNQEIWDRLVKMCKHYGIPIDYLSPANKDGETFTLGLWDYEGEWEKFVTLGAKRYMYKYIDKKGAEKYKMVCSGVAKDAVKYFLKINPADPMKEFVPGFKIPSEYSGRRIKTYIDAPETITVTDYQGNTVTYDHAYGLYMEGSDFTASLDYDFAEYLTHVPESSIYNKIN